MGILDIIRGKFNQSNERLSQKILNELLDLRSDLGAKIDSLGAKIEAQTNEIQDIIH